MYYVVIPLMIITANNLSSYYHDPGNFFRPRIQVVHEAKKNIEEFEDLWQKTHSYLKENSRFEIYGCISKELLLENDRQKQLKLIKSKITPEAKRCIHSKNRNKIIDDLSNKVLEQIKWHAFESNRMGKGPLPNKFWKSDHRLKYEIRFEPKGTKSHFTSYHTDGYIPDSVAVTLLGGENAGTRIKENYFLSEGKNYRAVAFKGHTRNTHNPVIDFFLANSAVVHSSPEGILKKDRVWIRTYVENLCYYRTFPF